MLIPCMIKEERRMFSQEKGGGLGQGVERGDGLLLTMVKREMEPVSERKNWAAQ